MRANGQLLLKTGDSVMVDFGAFTGSPRLDGVKFLPCVLGERDGGRWNVVPIGRGWVGARVREDAIKLKAELPAGAVVIL